MAQSGRLVVCGDAGAYPVILSTKPRFTCVETLKVLVRIASKDMTESHLKALADLLQASGIEARADAFKRFTALRAHSTTSKSTMRVVTKAMSDDKTSRSSATYPPHVIAEIQRAANEGLYYIRGAGAKRRVPNFDDLVFLGASVSRYPLEGYRERCDTNVTIGARYASKPLELDIPITIAGMSFGALGANAKQALGLGASAMGTSTTTGDGGMTDEEREASSKLVYQYLPSRYGMEPQQLRRADAIEVVIGQGAKPGGGGMLLGQKVSDRVASMRTLPAGIDQRSPCRHPDWTGPDDLEIKIRELREITNWEKPIYIKVGATRTDYDVMLAVKAGADAIVVDGMQGGTAATQDVFIEDVGIPTLACGSTGSRCTERTGHAPESATHRVWRHSDRRRRGQGTRSGRRRGEHRHGEPDGAQL